MTCSKPGPELDAEVATRVMEWEREALPPASDYGPTTRAYWVDRKTKRRMLSEMGTSGRTWDNRAFRRNSRIWSPSTSIADAWEVVEKLMADNWMLDMGWGKPDWWVCFFAPDDIDRLAYRGEAEAFSRAPTAPLAICLAALEAVENQ